MSSSSCLDFADRLIAIPQHLQAELELVLHLVQHVAERLGRRAQQLDDVLARLENRAERHRDDGVLAHHGLVHALVREDVLARRVEHFERRVGDDRREVLVVHGVDVRRIGADADRSEAERVARLDDAVDVLAAARAAAGSTAASSVRPCARSSPSARRSPRPSRAAAAFGAARAAAVRLRASALRSRRRAGLSSALFLDRERRPLGAPRWLLRGLAGLGIFAAPADLPGV